MEFENYERELKYLIKKNEKYTSKQFLEFLYENGYKLVESFEKEKHETYYDDNDFSILKRGDVMRGSNMVTEQFKGFLYKTNKCNPQKPYVSKLELGTKLRGQYKDVNEFIKELNIDVKGQLNIKLFANMKREVSIVEKDGDRLYVSYDKVKYFEKDELNINGKKVLYGSIKKVQIIENKNKYHLIIRAKGNEYLYKTNQKNSQRVLECLKKYCPRIDKNRD